MLMNTRHLLPPKMKKIRFFSDFFLHHFEHLDEKKSFLGSNIGSNKLFRYSTSKREQCNTREQRNVFNWRKQNIFFTFSHNHTKNSFQQESFPYARKCGEVERIENCLLRVDKQSNGIQKELFEDFGMKAYISLAAKKCSRLEIQGCKSLTTTVDKAGKSQLSVAELVQKSIDRTKAFNENDDADSPHKSKFNEAPTIHQTMAGRRRFYKTVGVQPVTDTPGHFKVTLDGRTLRTPSRGPLYLPNMDLALCIAAEWDAQTSVLKGIEPVSMPIMTLASTALDQIKTDPDTVITKCLGYLPTDSALFLTNNDDRLLLLKQKQSFSPVVRWLNRLLGTDLQSTQDMVARIAHSQHCRERLRKVLSSMDHFTLACVQSATYECKSLVLALAYVGRYLTLEQVKAASRLEEEFQLEIWGVVEGGHDMDRLNNSVNLSSVGLFMSLYYDEARHAHMLAEWKKLAKQHPAVPVASAEV